MRGRFSRQSEEEVIFFGLSARRVGCNFFAVGKLLSSVKYSVWQNSALEVWVGNRRRVARQLYIVLWFWLPLARYSREEEEEDEVERITMHIWLLLCGGLEQDQLSSL